MDNASLRASLLKHSKDVFSTMLGLEAAETEAPANTAEDQGSKVAALIGFGGDYAGSAVIGMSQALACKLASAMLMTEYTEMNDDVRDAMGEIANMVFGNVKTELEEELGPLSLSIPTVIVGSSFNVKNLSEPKGVRVWMQMSEGQFEMRLCVVRSARTSNNKAA